MQADSDWQVANNSTQESNWEKKENRPGMVQNADYAESHCLLPFQQRIFFVSFHLTWSY